MRAHPLLPRLSEYREVLLITLSMHPDKSRLSDLAVHAKGGLYHRWTCTYLGPRGLVHYTMEQTCTDERRYNCIQLIAPSRRIAEGRSEYGNSAPIELNMNALEDALVSELSPRACLLNVHRTHGRAAIPPGDSPLPERPWCEKHDGLIGNIGPFLSLSGKSFRLA